MFWQNNIYIDIQINLKSYTLLIKSFYLTPM